MPHRVCPWWIASLLASPVRRCFGQDPIKILSPYVSEGMTVLEPGPGMELFSIPLARLVGGRESNCDRCSIEDDRRIEAGAAKVNLLERSDALVTSADTIGISDLEGKVDFTLAFAMVHEFPAAAHFFDEVARASKSRARVLPAEPRGNVDQSRFAAALSAAAGAGFSTADRPKIASSVRALL